METENETKVEETTEETTEEKTEEETTKKEEDKEEEKPEETPEAKKSRLTRQLKQHTKKFDLEDESDSSKTTKKTKSSGIDKGDKAILIASGIKRGSEMELVEEYVENTGKSIDDVLDSKYFQAELKDLRTEETVKEATPTDRKRTGEGSKTTDDYEYDKYIKSGKLPENKELAQKLVNRRVKVEADTNIFTDQNVAGDKIQ